MKRSVGGTTIKLLIDSGASKNYVRNLESLPGVVPVSSPFTVKSIHGSNAVRFKCILFMFGVESDFFILPNIGTFDGIIGLDLLKQVNGIIDLRSEKIITDFGEEELEFHMCSNVNYSSIDKSFVPDSVANQLNSVFNRWQGVFADPEERLPYNTNVVATIRTIHDDPVYTKLYPYPAGVRDFVKKEIENMLADGIIRESRSPYNNPLWVVDKKGTDELGNKKKRLVIDFRKLNQITIEDKYPIPDIRAILSNLGNAKYFSTFDLKSGFYQILLAEKDREKTAFSVNNGKFEFCRLSMGLKNAPSIFQRAIDDVLREKIGDFIYVYMDDIIVFSSSADDHVEHINWVFEKLFKANMRLSAEKSRVFKDSVEYLGFVVTAHGIRTCKSKVEAIVNFPEPTTLFDVRSFLGLAGYYRLFVKNFATVAKPLTEILKGENGKVSTQRSRKVKISFDNEQRDSFNYLKRILSSEDVILLYPDFEKPFELTTDASSKGIGAVLAQNGRPIAMISRTLKGCEQNYATNERELLAIVWSLRALRGYLYGAKSIKIFTDHQPLIFATSEKNCNAKILRWKSFIDEHNATISYKPGKENVVADALSRQCVNALDNISTAATNHSEESLTNAIRRTDTPINCYTNQIFIEKGNNACRTSILFQSKKRHFISYSDFNYLWDNLLLVVNPSCVNAFYCDLDVLASFQHRLISIYPETRFWLAPNLVTDVINHEERKEIVVKEHLRAHRCVDNVVEAVLRDYYFPKMNKITREVVMNCRICQESKYQRHPVLQTMGETPIPKRPGEMLHIDIFTTDSKFFLTCMDKFSKFAVVKLIKSRSVVDVTPAILELINTYPAISRIYCDNEGSFNSFVIAELLNGYGITITSCPPHHSTSNGQVERFHSTLGEMARCLKEQRQILDTTELMLITVIEYNRTIHSVTGEKPTDIHFSTCSSTFQNIREKLIKAQEKQLTRFNKKRQDKPFILGEKVLVKTNRRIGNKLSPRYVTRRVQADLGSTVLIRGKIVHKDNIRKRNSNDRRSSVN